MQAIQFKEKAENEMKTKTSDLLEQQDSAKNQETLMKISEQIRNIFQLEMGSKKFLNKILDAMMQGHMRGNFVSKGKFSSFILKFFRSPQATNNFARQDLPRVCERRA